MSSNIVLPEPPLNCYWILMTLSPSKFENSSVLLFSSFRSLNDDSECIFQ